MAFEVGIVATKGEGILVFDFPSGNELQKYSMPSCGSKFEILGSNYIVFLHYKIKILEVWSWKTGKQHLRCPIPNKNCALAVTANGIYLAMGTATGTLLVWNLETGVMLHSFTAHYGKINVLEFTPDSEFLLSGGSDSVINGWLFADIVDYQASDSIKPYVAWADHSLPISDIACGIGGLIVSCSFDRTCKIWDMYRTRSLVISLAFPDVLTTVCLDPCQRFLLCGCKDGNIYKADLKNIKHKNIIRSKLVGHKQPIRSLQVSFNGSLAFSSTTDGGALIWDTYTRQLIRTVEKPSNMSPIIDSIALAYQYPSAGKLISKKKRKRKEKLMVFQDLDLTQEESSVFVLKLNTSSAHCALDQSDIKKHRVTVNRQWTKIQKHKQKILGFLPSSFEAALSNLTALEKM